jgi:DNA-binding response OmpR family regulator
MNRILVVEDESQLLDSIIDMLKIKQYDVVGVENGLKAIDISSSNKFDLIICDINLLDISGYEVLKSVKENEANVNCQFVFLSAFVEEDDIRKGMNLGADDYLTKPFSMNVLLDTVKSRLEIANKKKDVDSIVFNRKIFQFVNTNFSHEFLTPLNMIMSLSKILQEDTDLKEDVAQSLETIYNSGVRILKNIKLIIVNAIISNPEKHNYLLIEKICLSDVLNNILRQNINSTLFSAQITEGLFVSSNYEIVSFIFEELLHNGSRFKKPDSTPIVILKNENGKIIFKVKNETITETRISVDVIAPFKKFQSNLSLNGWGLGLYTVVESCKLLGYQLFIDSSNLHFEVTIAMEDKRK